MLFLKIADLQFFTVNSLHNCKTVDFSPLCVFSSYNMAETGKGLYLSARETGRCGVKTKYEMDLDPDVRAYLGPGPFFLPASEIL